MKLPSNIDPTFYDYDAQAEHRKVKLTLRKLNLEDLIPQVLRVQERLNWQRRLSFEALDEVERLPILIRPGHFSASTTSVTANGTAKVLGGRTTDGQMAHLSTDVDRSAIGNAYRELQTSFRAAGEVRPIGMVFSYKRTRGGWILHDGDFGTKRARVIPTDRGAVRLDKYLDVLHALVAIDWEGGQFGGTCAKAGSVLPEVVASVRNTYGSAVKAQLLLHLAELQLNPICGDMHRRFQRLDGVRWVVVDQELLAANIGCGKRAIQMAVAELEEDGILNTRRGFDGNGNPKGYRVDFEILHQMGQQ